jgi:hypothetical protein
MAFIGFCLVVSEIKRIFADEKSTFFVKPNGQNRVCSSYAMARKGAM